jgi:hypothetical protein
VNNPEADLLEKKKSRTSWIREEKMIGYRKMSENKGNSSSRS